MCSAYGISGATPLEARVYYNYSTHMRIKGKYTALAEQLSYYRLSGHIYADDILAALPDVQSQIWPRWLKFDAAMAKASSGSKDA